MNTCNFYHLTSTNNKPVCMIDISSISPFSQGSWQAGLDILRLAHPTQSRNTYFSSDKKLWNPHHIYNTARYVKRDQYSAPLHTVTAHCQYIMRNKRDLLRNWYKLFNRLLPNYLIIVGHCLFYFPRSSKLTIKRYGVQVLCIMIDHW